MSSTPGVFVAARRFFCTLCGTRPRPVSATASRAKRSADSIAAPRIASMNPLRRSRLTRLNSPYASLAAFTASSTVPKTPCSGSAGALAGACGAGCVAPLPVWLGVDVDVIVDVEVVALALDPPRSLRIFLTTSSTSLVSCPSSISVGIGLLPPRPSLRERAPSVGTRPSPR